jgi:hypothetical protein
LGVDHLAASLRDAGTMGAGRKEVAMLHYDRVYFQNPLTKEKIDAAFISTLPPEF